MCKALARRFRRQGIGEHTFAADHALSDDDNRHIGRRQIDIDARAEADDAKALAGCHPLALAQIADDAPPIDASRLIVVAAGAEEIAAHEALLDAIEKEWRLTAIWRAAA